MGQCCSCAAHDGLAVQSAPHQQSSKGSAAQVCRLAAKVELAWQSSAAGNSMLLPSCRCQNALACILQGTSKLIVAVASADTPVAVRASSVSSLTPSGSEKRHRAVAASPTRFFELLVSLLCQQSS